MVKCYQDWMIDYPKHIVIQKERYFYKSQGIHAETLNDLLGYKLWSSKGSLSTGGPSLKHIEDALTHHRLDYIVVEGDDILIKKEFGSTTKIKAHNSESLMSDQSIKTTRQLSDEDLLQISETLLAHFDPYTGALLDDDQLINQSEVQELIQVARNHLLNKVKNEIPSSFVKPWDQSEDEQLRYEYNAFMSIELISKIHNRSIAHIRQRLYQLNIIDRLDQYLYKDCP